MLKIPPTFTLDGLLVAVRLLCLTYKIDYEEIDSNTYALFSDRNKRQNQIGKACLCIKGIKIDFYIPIRDLLIQIGHPVSHPESEAFEAGITDAEEITLPLTWVLGNFETECSDTHILIKRGDNA